MKHFALSLVFISIMFLFLTLNCIIYTIKYKRQLNNEFENITIYLESIQKVPDWFEVVAREIKDEKIKIGLVNIDDIPHEIHRKAEVVKVHFDPVGKQIQWSDLFPPWISKIPPPTCPNIPMPGFENYQELDVIVANVSGCESRDVSGLQVNLVVANLLVRSGRKDHNGAVFAVFIGSCEPMWEIFRCEDLVWHEGNSWVYKPELRRIKQKVLMPVGTCQHVPSFSQFGEEPYWGSQNQNNHLPQQREAYVTILHSTEDYVCGAITLAQSIIRSNSTKDLVLLADNNISPKSLNGLRAAGWKIKHIERIRSTFSRKKAYNRWNYSKFRIWQLKEYDKVMFIDSDLIVKRNLDEFFIQPQLSAAGNCEKHFFNSGLMLIEPSICTFDTLMKKRFVIESYNGGDQGFLNEMFSWWHRLPAEVNYLKVFVDFKDHVHQIPEDVYAIHYFGLKPWKCRVDYDCNWNWPDFREYASNSAHERWLDVYYAMPEKLRQYCPRTYEMDVKLQHSRHKGANNSSSPNVL
ncbi:hypothetical protein ACJIZ3_005632 [Penstemon smallii]|uniref:Hexosyltransferase n=1 Tax=Penstemon smallii TaxID=265156 RepID=A0ABD3S5M8_9LAMI